MKSVGVTVGSEHNRHESRDELSRAHHTACSARYARRHGRGEQLHRGGGSVHERRHAVSSRYLNNAATAQEQVVAPHPAHRPVLTCVVITVAVGLLYIAAAGVFWPDMDKQLFWAGLLLIVVGGAVCENAIRFDAVRGRARSAGSDAVTQ